ncbi:MAG: Gfo/Idh/MocA family protein [Actinomycetales bacterium]
MPLPRTLPRARTPDPMEAPSLRWGVLGTGWIAEQFCSALRRNTTQRIVAVGSRTQESADRAAATLGAERAHGSYQSLVADDEVDVVYVATPHNFHHPHALLAMRAGKHVLVEKPMALNAALARELADEAAARSVFCMEAFWSFFLPKFDVLAQLLDDGVIGDLRTVLADHGQTFPADHRILRADLAGGPMLDLMTYPAGLAQWLLGTPREVLARATWLPEGVPGQTSILLRTDNDEQALLHSAVQDLTPTTASIGGTEGSIWLAGDFYTPGDFTVRSADGQTLTYTEPKVAHDALFWQATELARRVTAGELGSPLRPLQATIATLEIMDAARAQIGEVFAEERADPCQSAAEG